jgi:hypothetical protein
MVFQPQVLLGESWYDSRWSAKASSRLQKYLLIEYSQLGNSDLLGPAHTPRGEAPRSPDLDRFIRVLVVTGEQSAYAQVRVGGT